MTGLASDICQVTSVRVVMFTGVPVTEIITCKVSAQTDGLAKGNINVEVKVEGMHVRLCDIEQCGCMASAGRLSKGQQSEIQVKCLQVGKKKQGSKSKDTRKKLQKPGYKNKA